MIGCSSDTINTLLVNGDQDTSKFSLQGGFVVEAEGDGDEWEDLPESMQAQDAFVHALRELKDMRYVV